VAVSLRTSLLLDQAGWHTSANLEVLDNITLVAIPPRWPGLNPVENVWLFFQDSWF
jgi:putative transposase